MANIAHLGQVADLTTSDTNGASVCIAHSSKDPRETKDRFESPGSPQSTRANTAGGETLSSFRHMMIANTENYQYKNLQGDMWTKDNQERPELIEMHLHWLRNHEGRSWDERAIWLPTHSESATKIEHITWGQPSGLSKEGTLVDPIPWDEVSSQAFEYALKAQEDFNQDNNGTKPLSHVDIDVQGFDVEGNRVRVRRTLETKLKISDNRSTEGNFETTEMKLKHVLIIESPPACSLPPRNPRDREPYQAILDQLAQHEVNKAFDERNHFLREVFGQDVDHVRKRRESTIPTHNWSFQKPELCIQGPDGTMINLKEKRTDSAVDEEVVLTHTVRIKQVRVEGRSHLFDLPIEGSESERRIRQARRTLSSAIDRCIASGSAEMFVLDKWLDGTFLARS
jgi:hypothetical protein